MRPERITTRLLIVAGVATLAACGRSVSDQPSPAAGAPSRGVSTDPAVATASTARAVMPTLQTRLADLVASMPDSRIVSATIGAPPDDVRTNEDGSPSRFVDEDWVTFVVNAPWDTGSKINGAAEVDADAEAALIVGGLVATEKDVVGGYTVMRQNSPPGATAVLHQSGISTLGYEPSTLPDPQAIARTAAQDGLTDVTVSTPAGLPGIAIVNATASDPAELVANLIASDGLIADLFEDHEGNLRLEGYELSITSAKGQPAFTAWSSSSNRAFGFWDDPQYGALPGVNGPPPPMSTKQ